MGKLTTCSIEGCAKAPEVRGWCKAHYLRWYRHGDPLAGAPMRHPGRVCSVADCGEKCSARGYCAPHYRRWAAYGDPLGKPPVKAERGCAVDACGDKHEARGYCRRHYNRLRAYGDPLWEKPPRAIGTCSVEGCENPMRKRAWCASHYAQWTREGAVRPFKYRWRAERGACDNCGREVPEESRTRRYCSESCVRMFHANGGESKAEVACNRCGGAIDRRPDGRRGWIRDDVKLCRSCRHARAKNYGASAAEIAQRDGTDCSLCGEPVDMTLTRADGVMCASVDHVYPYSLGGSNDAENLALAHLKCNQLKLNRVGWSAIV